MRSPRSDDRPLVRGRSFQQGQLAVEQRGRHEVAGPLRQPLANHAPGVVKMDEADVRLGQAQPVPVSAGERRAGQDRVATAGRRIPQGRCQGVEPRPAIRIGERPARSHLFDICRRMKIVGVEESPLQRVGEPPPDFRLAGTAHAHHHECAWAEGVVSGLGVCVCHGPIVSHSAGRRPTRRRLAAIHPRWAAQVCRLAKPKQ